MRKTWLVCGILVAGALGIALRGEHRAPPALNLADLATGRVVVRDLGYPVGPDSPVWPDSEPFVAHVVATLARQGYFARTVCLPEHFSTHLDAPAHFPGGHQTVEQLDVRHFVVPAVVMDVEAQVRRNPDYRLSAGDVRAWERRYGPVPSGVVVLLRTGWERRGAQPEQYRNRDARGVMHFPGYSVEAARLLIERHVVGLGIDTLSIDYGPSQQFEVHRLTLPAGLYHLENLRNLEGLPARGVWLVVAPLALEGGSGAPVRVLALVPQPAH